MFNPFHLVTTSQQAQFGMFSISEDRIFKFNAESANNHECSPSDASSLAKGATSGVYVDDVAGIFGFFARFFSRKRKNRLTSYSLKRWKISGGGILMSC